MVSVLRLVLRTQPRSGARPDSRPRTDSRELHPWRAAPPAIR